MPKTTIIQSAPEKLARWVGVRTVALEVTQSCNQECVFCYNVWKCDSYPLTQPDTTRTLDLIDRIIRDYRPQVLTITGGEPLLRPDLVELIYRASHNTNVNLITNGTLMTDDLARELVKAKVRTFEFTLLSADRQVHNSLVGRESFDELIEGIASVKAAGGRVATTFVAMRPNIEGWEETLELNAALGVDGILFNRFNVGGAGIERARELMPTLDQLKQALEAANRGAERFGISISCGVPIPPCILDRSPYPNIGFGDCPAGTRRAYPTVDLLGNVRPCNHSPLILGNLFETNFRSIVRSDTYRSYAKCLPDMCVECEHAPTCRGGCRAAAEVCGDVDGVDPFVDICGEGGQKCAGCC